MASGRPAFGSRFNTGNIESALLSRGFHYGTAPNSVVIGWNGGHAAVTLPDGTPVSSGESGAGVRVGGGGAYQSQFGHHMYLPVQAEEMHTPATPETPDVVAVGETEVAPPEVSDADVAVSDAGSAESDAAPVEPAVVPAAAELPADAATVDVPA